MMLDKREGLPLAGRLVQGLQEEGGQLGDGLVDMVGHIVEGHVIGPSTTCRVCQCLRRAPAGRRSSTCCRPGCQPPPEWAVRKASAL